MCDETIPSPPAPITLTEYLRKWGVVLRPLLGFAAVIWVIHRIWHRFDILVAVIIWLPAGVTQAFFGYCRQFHPDRVPPVLNEDSDELARLKNKQAQLHFIGYLGCGVCVMLLLLIRLVTGAHPGMAEESIPDTAWLWMALPILAAGGCVFWGNALEAYIKQRRPPVVMPAGSVRARRQPTAISGTAFRGNRFHSDHWGEPVSNPQSTAGSNS